jgi:phosphopantetheine adenylyltransferase
MTCGKIMKDTKKRNKIINYSHIDTYIMEMNNKYMRIVKYNDKFGLKYYDFDINKLKSVH